MSKEDKGLNIRQLKFIDNLFRGMSGKKAYIEAGYDIGKEESAEQSASRLSRSVKVKEEVGRRLDDIDYRNRLRLRRMSETALANLLDIITKEENPYVKFNAIKDTLDRAGLKPVEQSEVSGTIEVVTAIPRPKYDKKDK